MNDDARTTAMWRNPERLATARRAAARRPKTRAPDSLQFNLVGDWSDEGPAPAGRGKARGVSVQVFGLSKDNAPRLLELAVSGPAARPAEDPRAMLMRACDTRLPARLKQPDLDFIAHAIVEAAAAVKADKAPVDSAGALPRTPGISTKLLPLLGPALPEVSLGRAAAAPAPRTPGPWP